MERMLAWAVDDENFRMHWRGESRRVDVDSWAGLSRPRGALQED